AKEWEGYLTGTLLPRIEQKLAEEPRRNRLHARIPTVCFFCDGEIVEDRWISLTLILRHDMEGEVTEQRDDRVWDGKTGLLCPLELFLPHKKAKRYCRWSYSVQGNEIRAIFAQKDGQEMVPFSDDVGKMKKVSSLS
ncbi:MAG: hypothetical protein J6R82_05865, partial [Clostridia bacterium]|nr:hypothetical protein [Clostridia bacterium]